MKIIEISFVLPIYYLCDEVTGKNAYEVKKIKEILGIRFDDYYLLNKYDSYGDGVTRGGKGDILVFRQEDDSKEFLVFDFYNGYTDQHNMVMFGVRCFENEEIKTLMISLHKRSVPTSQYTENEEENLLRMADIRNYPKLINDYGRQFYQHIESYYQHIESYINDNLEYRS